MTGPDDLIDDLGGGDADDALAGEYVLGVLDLADRTAVERRMASDPVFAARVTKWEAQFSGLDPSFAKAPAPNLLPQIEARLFGLPETRRSKGAAGAAVWWLKLIAGGGLAAAVAVAALFLVSSPQLPSAPTGPVLTVTLAGEGSPLVFAARYDANTGALTVERTGGTPAEAGQVHELWLIAGQAAPVPLGLIDAGPLTRTLPDLPEGAVLAVSLEPAGGSTTGAPTGPVLVTGVVTSET